MEIWAPKPPGTLWATPIMLQDSLPFHLYTYPVHSLKNSLYLPQLYCNTSFVTGPIRQEMCGSIYRESSER